MRLIDADALIKAVEDFPNCCNGWSDAYDKAFIIGAIEEAPTIDLVRCKKCIDFAYDELYKCYGCSNDNGLMGEIKPDDYCSYGEREGE